MRSNLIVPSMTQPKTDLKFTMAMNRGDVREAMGWSFVRRLEKLVDELLGKVDCPDVFWVIYSARWDAANKTIREMWQVDDSKPRNQMLGQIIYEVHKSGYATFVSLPFDIPVPDSELSNDIVEENVERAKSLPLSGEVFEAKA